MPELHPIDILTPPFVGSVTAMVLLLVAALLAIVAVRGALASRREGQNPAPEAEERASGSVLGI